MSDEEEFDSERYDTDADDDEKASEGEVGKRAYHNLLERKRRDNIKDSFCQLRDSLPCFSKKKKERASRVQILKKACEFLRKQERLRQIAAEDAILQEENKIMEQTLTEYETAIANDDMETIARLDAMDLPVKRRRYLLENENSDTEESESSDEGSSSPDTPPVVAVSPRRKAKRIKHH